VVALVTVVGVVAVVAVVGLVAVVAVVAVVGLVALVTVVGVVALVTVVGVVALVTVVGVVADVTVVGVVALVTVVGVVADVTVVGVVALVTVVGVVALVAVVGVVALVAVVGVVADVTVVGVVALVTVVGLVAVVTVVGVVGVVASPIGVTTSGAKGSGDALLAKVGLITSTSSLGSGWSTSGTGICCPSLSVSMVGTVLPAATVWRSTLKPSSRIPPSPTMSRSSMFALMSDWIFSLPAPSTRSCAPVALSARPIPSLAPSRLSTVISSNWTAS